MIRSTRNAARLRHDDGDAPADPDRRQFLGYTGAGLLAAVLPGCNDSAASSYGQTVAFGRQQIQAALQQHPESAGALSVALLKDNQIVWQEAFGNAAIASSGTPATPATLATRFNIGSNTKVISALAVMILRDRGLVDLDAPIVQYLPSFTMLSPEYTQITVRHLLSHASGFDGVTYCNMFSFGAPIPGYADATQAALANEHLKFLPGEMEAYCNDCFTMVEPLVAAVARQSYVDFVRQSILEPLAMTNSGFLTSIPTSGAFALPYINGMQYTQEFVNAYSTGGLSTTPSDMMNLAQMFLSGGMFQGKQIVSADGIAQMGSDQTKTLAINPGPIQKFGLGWDGVSGPALSFAGDATWVKTGGTPSFTSNFIVLPDVRMALMVAGSGGLGQHAIAVAILMRALQEDGSIRPDAPTVSTTAPSVATAPDVTFAAGIYGNQTVPLQVIVANGALQINQWTVPANGGTAGWQPLDENVTQYRYREDGWWWSDQNPQNSYRFDVRTGTDASGRAYRYCYLMQRASGKVNLGGLSLAQQLKPLAPLGAAWQARVGTSWVAVSEFANSEFVMLNDDKYLRCTLGRLRDLDGYVLFKGNGVIQLLAPLSDDYATTAVKVPGTHGSELYEISFSTTNGAQTMTVAGVQFKPA